MTLAAAPLVIAAVILGLSGGNAQASLEDSSVTLHLRHGRRRAVALVDRRKRSRPNADPREVVADIVSLNQLRSRRRAGGASASRSRPSTRTEPSAATPLNRIAGVASLSDLPIRDDLRGLTPYGAPQQHVRYALNVNENTHPIPEPVARHIVESLARAVLTMNRYPDREFTALRESLAGYLGHGIGPEQIWAANGSNEIIQQLLQAFGGPGRSVLGFPPTYSMHAIIAAGTGTAWVTAERDAGYELSPETVAAAIRNAPSPTSSSSARPTTRPARPLPLATIEAAYAASDYGRPLRDGLRRRGLRRVHACPISRAR